MSNFQYYFILMCVLQLVETVFLFGDEARGCKAIVMSRWSLESSEISTNEKVNTLPIKTVFINKSKLLLQI